MKHVLRILLCLFVLATGACQPSVTTTECINPLTYTDIPDNDWVRVGEDYYMVSTTMYFCPGAPIMHSKDLVHWRIVNYIYDYLADDDVYNLRNGRHAYGRGQWATSLRYHQGTYYALFSANDQRKTYVYKTTDIEHGPWEQTVLDRHFHDASLLFDHNQVYLVWGNGDLQITELNSDLSGVKEGGVDQRLLSAPREGYGLRAEGSHFYHIGDYYYVLVIDWPSGGIRTESCWRSKNLLGPYERKVVLNGTFDGRQDGVAQGGLLQTQHGDWYAMMFQDHGAVGRIPTLQPVTWVDGWPIMGDNTLPVKQFTVNLPPQEDGDYVWASDAFDYSNPDDLALVWQWNHKPENAWWSVTERPGWLRLTAGHLATNIMDARNTLTQRTVGPSCRAEVLLDAAGMKPGDNAGLCAFQSHYAQIGVTVAADGTKWLTAFTRIPPQQARQREASPTAPTETKTEALRIPLTDTRVWLRIDYVFTPEAGSDTPPDTAYMSYSLDGTTWHPVDATLHMRYTLDLFTGYRTALYQYATTAPGGYADFDYFRQEVL